MILKSGMSRGLMEEGTHLGSIWEKENFLQKDKKIQEHAQDNKKNCLVKTVKQGGRMKLNEIIGSPDPFQGLHFCF